MNGESFLVAREMSGQTEARDRIREAVGLERVRDGISFASSHRLRNHREICIHSAFPRAPLSLLNSLEDCARARAHVYSREMHYSP